MGTVGDKIILMVNPVIEAEPHAKESVQYEFNFLEGKKSILTNFQIFIKSKYPGHNIEAFYELNNLIVPGYYINLKMIMQ